MPALETCEREIESLHDFFVRWYDGSLEREAFDRLETALAPGFEMVHPDGTRHDRADVLERIRDDYDRDEPVTFDIEIRNVERRDDLGDHALVRYEEVQTADGETTTRVSTVLFGVSPETETETETGLVWLDLHETWLEE